MTATMFLGVESQSDDLFDVVHRQRACRSFSDAPVDDDAVARILEAAVRAPSAENTQPWHFVVVRDRARREAISAVIASVWDSGGREYSRPRLDAGLFGDVDRALSVGFADAPLMIVVCGDTDRGAPGVLASSVYPAVQNILLAATALGLGSVLTTIANIDPAPLRAAVDLPDTLVPLAVIPVGHGARPLGPSRRDPFADRTSRDSYGRPW